MNSPSCARSTVVVPSSRMTSKIVACEGTVEKYIGDEIFAVFGMPTPGDRDAENALRCAEQMLKAVDQWNDERQKLQEPPLRIGIGLNEVRRGARPC